MDAVVSSSLPHQYHVQQERDYHAFNGASSSRSMQSSSVLKRQTNGTASSSSSSQHYWQPTSSGSLTQLCSCCPYGYHIDLGFLGFLDGTENLAQLRKIRRRRTFQRQALEASLLVQRQYELQHPDASDAASTCSSSMRSDDEDSSAEQQNRGSSATTSRLLEEIDASIVDALTSIDVLMTSKKQSVAAAATIQKDGIARDRIFSVYDNESVTPSDSKIETPHHKRGVWNIESSSTSSSATRRSMWSSRNTDSAADDVANQERRHLMVAEESSSCSLLSANVERQPRSSSSSLQLSLYDSLVTPRSTENYSNCGWYGINDSSCPSSVFTSLTDDLECPSSSVAFQTSSFQHDVSTVTSDKQFVTTTINTDGVARNRSMTVYDNESVAPSEIKIETHLYKRGDGGWNNESIDNAVSAASLPPLQATPSPSSNEPESTERVAVELFTVLDTTPIVSTATRRETVSKTIVDDGAVLRIDDDDEGTVSESPSLTETVNNPAVILSSLHYSKTSTTRTDMLRQNCSTVVDKSSSSLQSLQTTSCRRVAVGDQPEIEIGEIRDCEPMPSAVSSLTSDLTERLEQNDLDDLSNLTSFQSKVETEEVIHSANSNPTDRRDHSSESSFRLTKHTDVVEETPLSSEHFKVSVSVPEQLFPTTPDLKNSSSRNVNITNIDQSKSMPLLIDKVDLADDGPVSEQSNTLEHLSNSKQVCNSSDATLTLDSEVTGSSSLEAIAATTSSSSALTEAVIHSDSLMYIRRNVADSLQQMRQLERQVKAIPVLQARLSVLKEEKRLLQMQLLSAKTAAEEAVAKALLTHRSEEDRRDASVQTAETSYADSTCRRQNGPLIIKTSDTAAPELGLATQIKLKTKTAMNANVYSNCSSVPDNVDEVASVERHSLTKLSVDQTSEKCASTNEAKMTSSLVSPVSRKLSKYPIKMISSSSSLQHKRQQGTGSRTVSNDCKVVVVDDADFQGEPDVTRAHANRITQITDTKNKSESAPPVARKEISVGPVDSKLHRRCVGIQCQLTAATSPTVLFDKRTSVSESAIGLTNTRTHLTDVGRLGGSTGREPDLVAAHVSVADGVSATTVDVSRSLTRMNSKAEDLLQSKPISVEVGVNTDYVQILNHDAKLDTDIAKDNVVISRDKTFDNLSGLSGTITGRQNLGYEQNSLDSTLTMVQYICSSCSTRRRHDSNSDLNYASESQSTPERTTCEVGCGEDLVALPTTLETTTWKPERVQLDLSTLETGCYTADFNHSTRTMLTMAKSSSADAGKVELVKGAEDRVDRVAVAVSTDKTSTREISSGPNVAFEYRTSEASCNTERCTAETSCNTDDFDLLHRSSSGSNTRDNACTADIVIRPEVAHCATNTLSRGLKTCDVGSLAKPTSFSTSCNTENLKNTCDSACTADIVKRPEVAHCATNTFSHGLKTCDVGSLAKPTSFSTSCSTENWKNTRDSACTADIVIRPEVAQCATNTFSHGLKTCDVGSLAKPTSICVSCNTENTEIWSNYLNYENRVKLLDDSSRTPLAAKCPTCCSQKSRHKTTSFDVACGTDTEHSPQLNDSTCGITHIGRTFSTKMSVYFGVENALTASMCKTTANFDDAISSTGSADVAISLSDSACDTSFFDVAHSKRGDFSRCDEVIDALSSTETKSSAVNTPSDDSNPNPESVDDLAISSNSDQPAVFPLLRLPIQVPDFGSTVNSLVNSACNTDPMQVMSIEDYEKLLISISLARLSVAPVIDASTRDSTADDVAVADGDDTVRPAVINQPCDALNTLQFLTDVSCNTDNKFNSIANQLKTPDSESNTEHKTAGPILTTWYVSCSTVGTAVGKKSSGTGQTVVEVDHGVSFGGANEESLKLKETLHEDTLSKLIIKPVSCEKSVNTQPMHCDYCLNTSCIKSLGSLKEDTNDELTAYSRVINGSLQGQKDSTESSTTTRNREADYEKNPFHKPDFIKPSLISDCVRTVDDVADTNDVIFSLRSNGHLKRSSSGRYLLDKNVGRVDVSAAKIISVENKQTFVSLKHFKKLKLQSASCVENAQNDVVASRSESNSIHYVAPDATSSRLNSSACPLNIDATSDSDAKLQICKPAEDESAVGERVQQLPFGNNKQPAARPSPVIRSHMRDASSTADLGSSTLAATLTLVLDDATAQANGQTNQKSTCDVACGTDLEFNSRLDKFGNRSDADNTTETTPVVVGSYDERVTSSGGIHPIRYRPRPLNLTSVCDAACNTEYDQRPITGIMTSPHHVLGASYFLPPVPMMDAVCQTESFVAKPEKDVSEKKVRNAAAIHLCDVAVGSDESLGEVDIWRTSERFAMMIPLQLADRQSSVENQCRELNNQICFAVKVGCSTDDTSSAVDANVELRSLSEIGTQTEDNVGGVDNETPQQRRTSLTNAGRNGRTPPTRMTMSRSRGINTESVSTKTQAINTVRPVIQTRSTMTDVCATNEPVSGCNQLVQIPIAAAETVDEQQVALDSPAFCRVSNHDDDVDSSHGDDDEVTTTMTEIFNDFENIDDIVSTSDSSTAVDEMLETGNNCIEEFEHLTASQDDYYSTTSSESDYEVSKLVEDEEDVICQGDDLIVTHQLTRRWGTVDLSEEQQLSTFSSVSSGRKQTTMASSSSSVAMTTTPFKSILKHSHSMESKTDSTVKTGVGRRKAISFSQDVIFRGEVEEDTRSENSSSSCYEADVFIDDEIEFFSSHDTSPTTKSLANGELSSACNTYALWLRDSTEVTSKQLNHSMKLLRHEWFAMTSQKTSNTEHISGFLRKMAHLSPELLKQVVNMVDDNGNSSLHYAMSNGRFDIVRCLLDTGCCDVGRQNRTGCTTIMLASLVPVNSDDDRRVIERLMLIGDVNQRAALAGQTALMLAASRNRSDIVRMLLDAGAEVNTQDDDGSTALMCASEHGYMVVVRMLLAHPGCDSSIEDNEGSTATSIAMEAGHQDVALLLYAHSNFKKSFSSTKSRRTKPSKSQLL